MHVPSTLFINFAGIITLKIIIKWIKTFRTQKGNLMGIYDEKKNNLLIWYKKTGHFGPETLKTLVQRVKNIKIKRPIFLEYNIYAQTHGKIIVLKRLKKSRTGHII